MSTLKLRAPRPKTKHFSSSGLVKQWEELLTLRNPGFSWDGSSRVDSHEMQAVAKVRLYKKPLMKLLAVAETGFPAHGDLADLMRLIHKDFPVFEMEGELPMGVVNEMSLAWRNMCKTVYELKKQDMYPPDLKYLVDLIVLPTATGHATGSADPLQDGAAQEDSSSLTVDEVACMFVDEDMSDTADDVDIVSVTCSCADCVKTDGEKQVV